MKLRIRELRKSNKLTGEQLADLVGISKGYVSELETGKKSPGADLLMRLADALHCEVHELFSGSQSERDTASLATHLEVMSQLSADDRRSIERAALGLLAKRNE
ncbi:XRE family transcriptional regulator [Gemmobacter lutimaris]|uniref:XRE family transcriptional regulator n=1 Tax=Gemmobacter lutimaris TaxID=2306023 RepID=A0A398BWD5_9RHOB|nr:helix-turn-helix transcriptional regulator [Gemmobacter lutimaris]RID91526.1 XRE family transcriptional regulator [Gemmobacter lutimaris]